MALYPIVQNGDYGFIRDDGSIAIPPQFESGMTFTEGLAGIQREGKWGFINEEGELIIPARFDNCRPFAHGLALVEDGPYKNYIDKLGNVIITTNFYNCGSFEGDLAPVMPDIRSRGAFIDRNGAIVLRGRNYLTSHYSHGLINCDDGGKWGYVNRSGVFEILPKYAYARPFHDGLAAVAPRRETEFCFIDPKGNVAFDGVFQGADIEFSDGLCAVWDERFGYIDRTGRIMIPYCFEFADHFSEGLAVVKEPESNYYGYVNRAGNIAIKQAFTCAEAFQGKIASVTVGDDFESYHNGYIDQMGRYVWKPSR